MPRTGEQYLQSLRDGRQVWIKGERVNDVTVHPAFRPIVSLRARLYDMAHKVKYEDSMSYRDEISNEPCGGHICVTPDLAAFEDAETKPWLEKYYTVNEAWSTEDQRRLLAFARDLMNSDYAGHRVTFELFAQSTPFAHLNAVFINFAVDGALRFVKEAAGLSDRVMRR